MLSCGGPGTAGPAAARAEAGAGVRDALTTVVPSIVAYGVVWGGLARQAGLSLGELVAMCLLVTAGTAQFVALPMLQAGAPAWLLVVTTYIVNLRHYLMAASLAPHFAHLSRGRLALLAHGVTDESYALTMARFSRARAASRRSMRGLGRHLRTWPGTSGRPRAAPGGRFP